MRLKDKVAIVTGAAHGIGLAIARHFVAEGARVTIADVDAPAGEAEARALGNARFLATDVGDAPSAANAIAETCRAFGDLDIAVNNAGIIHAADFLDLAEADFDRVLRVNLKGAFLVGQAAARRMVAQVKAGKPPGAIVNISSINADILKAVATDQEAKRRILSRTPLGRIGEPDEIASIAVFLASPEASYMTGETIYADGGRLALNYTVPVEAKALE